MEQKDTSDKMKIIVQDLGWWRSNTELEEFFSRYGRVRVEMYSDIAHVIFDNDDDAIRLCDLANKHTIRLDHNILRLPLVSGDHSPIDVLDDLCMITIFEHLHAKSRLVVERVCKRWRNLALKSWSAVKSLNVEDVWNLNININEYIKRCGRYVQNVYLDGYADEPLLLSVQEHCINLKFIATPAEAYRGQCYEILLAMLRELSQLQGLKISDIDEEFQFDFLDDFSEKMVALTFSTIEGNYPSRNVSSSLDFSKFHNLERLELSRFVIEENALKSLLILEHLKHLHLRSARWLHPHLDDLQHLHNLQGLTISSCHVNDDLLIKIVKNNSGLETLNINDNEDLTDRSLMLISTLQHLQVLSMSNSPNVSLRFMEEMPRLRTLNCNRCGGVTNDALEKILNTSPTLKFLDISNCGRINDDIFYIARAAVQARNNKILLKIETNLCADIEFSPLLEIHSSWDYDQEDRVTFAYDGVY